MAAKLKKTNHVFKDEKVKALQRRQKINAVPANNDG